MGANHLVWVGIKVEGDSVCGLFSRCKRPGFDRLRWRQGSASLNLLRSRRFGRSYARGHLHGHFFCAGVDGVDCADSQQARVGGRAGFNFKLRTVPPIFEVTMLD